MPKLRTPGILNLYENLPLEIREYFYDFPSLVNGYSWDVSISYMFSLVELAQNMSIYCGVVKLHKVEIALARVAIDNHHMTRAEFRRLFDAVFGKELKKSVRSKIAKAEKIRDRIVHGKTVSDADKRSAVVDMNSP